MVKKSNIFGIALLLGLTLTNVNLASAGDNNLVQLDLHKSSNNAVDLTFFTTNSYQDNIVVRKKSDNKYVVLMPRVLSSGYSAPDLGSVKDLVSHVDVKSVNESGNEYTKVTLITTKPINIKTKTQKSGPITAEEKEYKTLIAEANTIKNNIGKNSTIKQENIQRKTNITVNKVQTQPTIVDNKKVQPKANVKKQEIKTDTSTRIAQEKKNPVTEITKKIETKTNSIKDNLENKYPDQQQDLENIVPTITQTEQQAQTTQSVQNTESISKEISKEKTLPSHMLVLNSTIEQCKQTIQEVLNNMPAGVTAILMFILLPIIGLLVVARIIKAALVNSKILKESFLNHLAERPTSLNTLKYNNIVNNKDLNWQQKYQRYLDASAKPVSRGTNKGNYTFIKQPAPEEIIEQKRQQLEQMVADMAPQDQDINPEIIEIHNEENVIHDELQKTVKLKAFDSVASLSMSHRGEIKSRFKKYEQSTKLKEGKNVELGSSALHTNKRRMKDSNLNVAEIQALKQRAKEMNIDENDYVMSSMEEYFSILDKEQTAKAEYEKRKATSPISKSIAKIRPTLDRQHDIAGIMQPSKSQIQLEKTETAKLEEKQTLQSNPIEKLRNETKDSYINGLIVKSGFNIDNNKGFYIVNHEGKSALIGRVNEEVFVLKKFDKNIDKPIQVRHDNANVYMVKADNFKSLVEVNDNKMGVLIEL